MKTQTFGIEIETFGIGRRATSKAIADCLGGTYTHIGRHLDDWHIEMPDGRHWTVESDGSVTDPSAEIVSPVCTWDDIEMVQNVVRAVRRAGARVDESCGIHVHIGLGNHTPKTLRNLVNVIAAKEPYLTRALGISAYRRGRWCKVVEPAFLDRINRKHPKTWDEFARAWYGVDEWRYNARTHYDNSRYHLLNLHAAFSTERPAHTIEFRAFNGSLHAGEIKAYIQFCMALSHHALTIASASPRVFQAENPAYYFRVFLLHIGLIGDEFKTARLHLLKNLEGNTARRDGAWSQRRAAV